VIRRPAYAGSILARSMQAAFISFQLGVVSVAMNVRNMSGAFTILTNFDTICDGVGFRGQTKVYNLRRKFHKLVISKLGPPEEYPLGQSKPHCSCLCPARWLGRDGVS
jgi:hypothetical protein